MAQSEVPLRARVGSRTKAKAKKKSQPENWAFYQSEANAKMLAGGFLNDGGSIMNAGIILGALLATLLASQFRIKMIKNYKQVIGAVAGGLLMGYGVSSVTIPASLGLNMQTCNTF